MTHSHSRKGFTLIELLVVISIIALLIGILLPALQRAKRNAGALKDGAQIKQIHLAMTTYATSNSDRYPVPSLVDRQGYTEGANLTAAQPGDTDPDRWHKNRTGPIYSIMIHNGSIVPEIVISPNETNGSIEQDGDYHYSPSEELTGVNVEGLASWDPTFAGTPANDELVREGGWITGAADIPTGGNVSYAHQPLEAVLTARAATGRNSFRSSDPILSNRGPAYSNSGHPAAWPCTPTEPLQRQWFLASGQDSLLGENSDTLNFAGSSKSWSGNVAYNDNHVSLEQKPDPDSWRSATSSSDQEAPAACPDNIFVDEQNESQRLTHRRSHQRLPPCLGRRHRCFTVNVDLHQELLFGTQ